MSTSNGPFRLIPIDQMVVNPLYQRDLSEQHVQRLVDTWDDDLCDAPAVAELPDGRYAAWDGQSRLEAQKRLGRTKVWCRVTRDADTARQAALFCWAQQNRLTLTKLDQYKAGIQAGSGGIEGFDADLAIKAVSDSLELAIGRTADATRPALTAIGALQWLYSEGRTDLLYDTLWVAQQAWAEHGYRDAYAAKYLKALGIFLRDFDADRAERKNVIVALHGHSPQSIEEKARRRSTTTTAVSARMSEEIKTLYNQAGNGSRLNNSRQRAGIMRRAGAK